MLKAGTCLPNRLHSRNATVQLGTLYNTNHAELRVLQLSLHRRADSSVTA